MELSKDEQRLLRQAIENWSAGGIIDAKQAEAMRDSIGAWPSQRQQLAQYFFIIAVSSALLAFGALFLDEKILEQLRRSFLLSNYTIAFAAAVLTAISFWLVQRRHRHLSETAYEAYLIPGGLCTLVALTYFCKEVGAGAGYTFLTGLCALVLFAEAAGFRSRVLWVGCLLALMGWFGAFSTVHAHHNLFLGLNYPARFSVFGLLIIGLSWLLGTSARTKQFQGITYHAGILICFTGLWGVSVFGNFGSLDAWQTVRQARMLPYAIATGASLAGSLFLGIRRNDAVLRDYSILFLLLHLYTRYFEYFWDALNKGLFFLVLAISFGLLARWLARKR
jgi:uncharacterized membrane protein